MADLEARREARRRKILENSEKRLSKITGVVRNTDPQKEGTTSASSSNLLHQHYFNEPVHFNSTLSNDDDVFSNALDGQYENSVVDQISDLASNNSLCNNNPVIQTNHKNLYVLLLGLFQGILFIYLDFLQVNIKILNLDYIFLPLIALEIIYYILDLPVESFPIIDTVLAFCNIKSKTFVIFLNLARHFFQILQDVALYFFVFIVIVQISNGLSKIPNL